MRNNQVIFIIVSLFLLLVQSNLNANNILIKADTGSATLESANLIAKENIVVDAKTDINVLAKQYREGEMHSTSKSSWGGLSQSVIWLHLLEDKGDRLL